MRYKAHIGIMCKFHNKMIIRKHLNIDIMRKKSFAGTGALSHNLLACDFFQEHNLPHWAFLQLITLPPLVANY